MHSFSRIVSRCEFKLVGTLEKGRALVPKCKNLHTFLNNRKNQFGEFSKEYLHNTNY